MAHFPEFQFSKTRQQSETLGRRGASQVSGTRPVVPGTAGRVDEPVVIPVEEGPIEVFSSDEAVSGVVGHRTAPGRRREPIQVGDRDSYARPISSREIPKDRGNLWMLAGLALVLLFSGYMIWGFVSPAVDPAPNPTIEGNQSLR